MSVLCVNAYKSGSSKYVKERNDTFSLIPQYIANDIYLIWDYVTTIGNGAHEYIVHMEKSLWCSRFLQHHARELCII